MFVDMVGIQEEDLLQFRQKPAVRYTWAAGQPGRLSPHGLARATEFKVLGILVFGVRAVGPQRLKPVLNWPYDGPTEVGALPVRGGLIRSGGNSFKSAGFPKIVDGKKAGTKGLVPALSWLVARIKLFARPVPVLSARPRQS